MASAGKKVGVGRGLYWQSFTKFHTGKAKAAGVAQVSSECHGEGADKMEMGEEESWDHLPGLPAARAATASG